VREFIKERGREREKNIKLLNFDVKKAIEHEIVV
jgi:hypothetical protein